MASLSISLIFVRETSSSSLRIIAPIFFLLSFCLPMLTIPVVFVFVFAEPLSAAKARDGMNVTVITTISSAIIVFFNIFLPPLCYFLTTAFTTLEYP